MEQNTQKLLKSSQMVIQKNPETLCKESSNGLNSALRDRQMFSDLPNVSDHGLIPQFLYLRVLEQST